MQKVQLRNGFENVALWTAKRVAHELVTVQGSLTFQILSG